MKRKREKVEVSLTRPRAHKKVTKEKKKGGIVIT